jgi:hypothetical protein
MPGEDIPAAEAETTATQPPSDTPPGASSFSGLSEAHQALVTERGYQDAGAVLDALSAAETARDGRLVLPGEDASDEAAGFEFAMPEGLPEGFAYDADLVTSFKGVFYEAGLTPKQAQIVHDAFVSQSAAAQKAVAEQTGQAQAQAQQAAEAAAADWIKDNGEDALKATVTFVQEVGGPELAAELDASGLGNNTKLMTLLNRMRLERRDDSFTGGSAGEGKGDLQASLDRMYPTMKKR